MVEKRIGEGGERVEEKCGKPKSIDSTVEFLKTPVSSRMMWAGDKTALCDKKNKKQLDDTGNTAPTGTKENDVFPFLKKKKKYPKTDPDRYFKPILCLKKKLLLNSSP